MSNALLTRMCGYGNNPKRIRGVVKAKASAQTFPELVQSIDELSKRKTRKDKMSGDPIWEKLWHHFTEVKKGQSFRSELIKTERVKDEQTGKWVHKSTWRRHAKRFMVNKMAELHAMALKWEPYLEWRAAYLALNPNVPRD